MSRAERVLPCRGVAAGSSVGREVFPAVDRQVTVWSASVRVEGSGQQWQEGEETVAVATG